MTLRGRLIRLAHEKPEFRSELLPLLSKTAKPWWDPSSHEFDDWEPGVGKVKLPHDKQEIVAVRQLMDMFLDGSPNNHPLDLKKMYSTLPPPVRKSVQKFLPAMISTGHPFGKHKNISLLWETKPNGDYDKDHVVVLRGHHGPGGVKLTPEQRGPQP